MAEFKPFNLADVYNVGSTVRMRDAITRNRELAAQAEEQEAPMRQELQRLRVQRERLKGIEETVDFIANSPKNQEGWDQVLDAADQFAPDLKLREKFPKYGPEVETWKAAYVQAASRDYEKWSKIQERAGMPGVFEQTSLRTGKTQLRDLRRKPEKRYSELKPMEKVPGVYTQTEETTGEVRVKDLRRSRTGSSKEERIAQGYLDRGLADTWEEAMRMARRADLTRHAITMGKADYDAVQNDYRASPEDKAKPLKAYVSENYEFLRGLGRGAKPADSGDAGGVGVQDFERAGIITEKTVPTTAKESPTAPAEEPRVSPKVRAGLDVYRGKGFPPLGVAPPPEPEARALYQGPTTADGYYKLLKKRYAGKRSDAAIRARVKEKFPDWKG